MRISYRARLALLSLVTITLAMSCEDRVVPVPTGVMPFEFLDVPAYIPADGVSQLEVTATVVSTEGIRLVNIPVIFSATEGTLTQSTALTDSSGIATTHLISTESRVDVTGYVDASVDSPYTVAPKTTPDPLAQVAPPGSIAIVTVGQIHDEELEARLHAILLKRAYENAQERRKGMGALLGESEGGRAGGLQESEADRLTVIHEGIEITLTSDKSQLPADGISTTSISARVRTATRGINVSGADISFAAQKGQITSSATTDDFGIAQVTFKAAITSATTDTIMALLGNTLSDTLALNYTQPVLTIAADDSYLPSDRNSSTAVRARLLTQAGIPIEGATVEFSLSGPSDVSIVVLGATNASGEAIATVKAGETEGTATITATFSDLSASTTVDILGIDLTLTSAKPSILADGRSITRITFIAKTKTTNVAVVGETITFSTDLGTIPATATTNPSGIAQVDLTSGTTAGTATIEASLAGLSVTTTVDFIAVATNVGITASSSSVLRDGVSTSTVNATVTDNNGNPMASQSVTWSLSAGTGSLNSTGGTTDLEGKAAITYTADASDSIDGSGTVLATVNGVSDNTVIAVRGISLNITSSKTSILADDNDPSTIILQAIETVTGNPVVGKQVSFETNLGSIIAAGTTDTDGKATSTFKSNSTGTAQIIATLGNTRSASINVSVTTQALTTTLSADPSSVLRDGQSTTTLTVRISDNSGNGESGQTVSWSLIGSTPSGVSLSTSSTTTGPNGQSTITLFTDAGIVDATASVRAAIGSSADTLDITLHGLVLLLTTAKSSIPANSTSNTTVTLVAKTEGSNVAVVGKTVTFSTDLGTIPATSQTNIAGTAVATLTSSTTSGTATVTAQIGGVSTTAQVTFAATANITVELSSPTAKLLRDGTDQTTLTAKVVDGDGTALADRVVTFTLTGVGSLSSNQPQQTGQNGIATVSLLADASTIDGTATIIASSEGLSDTLAITMRGISMVLTASPTSIVANGINSSTLSLLLRETTTNAGVPGRTIQFATTLGTIPATSITNSSGVASVVLTSSSNSGTATVTAAISTVSTNTTVTMVVESLNLTLSAGQGSILRDGIATVDLTVTVQDPNGLLLDNRDVLWNVSGGGSVFPTIGQTGVDDHANGTHRTTLTADAGGTDATATVTVTVGDSIEAVNITLNGVKITSTVHPDTILANGATTATFTWQASETTSGAAILNHAIVIAKASGPSVLLSDVSTATNASGSASAKVTSTTDYGTLVLQATMGTVAKRDSIYLRQDQYTVSLEYELATIIRDGEGSTKLTASVIDHDKDPVANQRVDFALTGDGALSNNFANTNSNGVAEITITADVDSVNGSAQIVASVGSVSDTVTVSLYGVKISIKAYPTSLVADGVHQSTIELTVKEAGSSTPLVGRTVTFAIPQGTYATITAQDSTDSRGIASATLTADTTAAASFTATVTGRLGRDPFTILTASTDITIVPPVRNVNFPTGQPDRILRNNEASGTLTARITDNNGDPVSDETVAWSKVGATPLGATLSVLSSTTDGSGLATVDLSGDANTADATASIRAAVGSADDTLDVTLQGITLTVAVQPDTITANAVDVSEITATLKETTSGRGVDGETLTFATTLGTIGGTAVTDVNGKATTNLIAGILVSTADSTAEVTVYSGPIATGISATSAVVFITPTSASISLTASPTSLQVRGTGGTETAAITATVYDKDNKAVPSGVRVAFSLSPTNAGTFEGSATVDTVETNSSGQATVQFQSGTIASDVTITATIVGSSVQSSASLITVVAGPTENLSVSSSVIELNSQSGLYKRTITALLSDTYGNAISSTNVVWTASPDAIGSIVGNSTTDDSGVAQSVFTYAANTELAAVTFTAVNQDSSGSLLVQGNLQITIGSSSILRDGVSTSTITVAAIDFDGSDMKLSDRTVTWSISAGTGAVSPTTTTTDANGQATTTFTADAALADGTGTVQAAVSSSSDTETITLRGVTLAVTTSPDTLSAGGTSTATISASLTETVNHVGISGKTISYTATSGIIGSSAITGTNGSASVTLTPASAAGTDTITGTYGGLTDSTYVVYISSGVANISPVASDTATIAYTESDSLIAWNLSVIVSDSLFNPVTGVEVRWSASPDTLGSIVSSTTSDANGVATTTVVYHLRFGGENITVTVRSGSAVRTETIVLPTP